MTREELTTMGLTPEQIDKVMAEYGAGIQREKAKADKLKAKADRVDEVEEQLNAINQQNMTDIEKANAERDKALEALAQAEAINKSMALKTSLAEKGIIGDNADKLIASLGSGSIDVDILGQIISENRTDAANAKLKEIQDGQMNPGGSSSNNNQGNNLSLADKLATQIYGNKTNNNDVLSSYID